MTKLYGIQRVEKYKKADISGIQNEVNRTADYYNNDVDLSRTKDNVSLFQCNDWQAKIDSMVKEHNIRVRKDSNLFVGSFYGASADFFKQRETESLSDYQSRIDNYFNDCLNWHIKTYCGGDQNLVLSAVIHYDETTPHLQVYSIPIIKGGQSRYGDGYSLSAKKLLGNIKAYTDRVDGFHRDVSAKYGLERGEHLDGPDKKKHITAQQHKLDQAKQQTTEFQNMATNAANNLSTIMLESEQLSAKNSKLKKDNSCLQNQADILQKQIGALEDKRQYAQDSLSKDREEWAKFHHSTFSVLEHLQAFHTVVEHYEPEYSQAVNEFLEYWGQDQNDWPEYMTVDDEPQANIDDWEEELGL